MNVLIVGGGKLVYFLCRNFLSKGYNVTVINRKHEECVKLSRQTKATIIYGDGSDVRILEDAEIDCVEVVLAVTPNDHDNLIICQLAKIKFNVPRTIALVNDPDNEKIFAELGVSSTFSTTHIISKLIEQRTGFEDITNLVPLGEGKINLTEIILKQDSPILRMPLKEIKLPDSSLIISIIRQGEPIIPGGGTVLKEGDKLNVITLPDSLGEVLKIITGE